MLLRNRTRTKQISVFGKLRQSASNQKSKESQSPTAKSKGLLMPQAQDANNAPHFHTNPINFSNIPLRRMSVHEPGTNPEGAPSESDASEEEESPGFSDAEEEVWEGNGGDVEIPVWLLDRMRATGWQPAPESTA